MKRILTFLLVALTATMAFAQPRSKAPREGLIVKNIPAFDQLMRHKNQSDPSVNRRTPEFPPEEMIMEQPEGESKLFTNQGMTVMPWGGVLEYYEQDPRVMQVVFAPDGKTVYFEKILTWLYEDYGWIKGELSEDGKEIRMPSNQYYGFVYSPGYPEWDIEEEFYGLRLSLVRYRAIDAETFTYDAIDDDIVWLVDEEAGTITLSPEVDGDDMLLGMIFDKPEDPSMHGYWSGYADYATVFTPLIISNPTPPEGKPVLDYGMTYTYDNGWNPTRIMGTLLQVVFDDNEVYIKGLSSQFPEVWLKGELADGKVSIPSCNIGINDWGNVYFFAPLVEEEMYGWIQKVPGEGDVVFLFDEETQTISLEEGKAYCFANNHYNADEEYVNVTASPFTEVAAVPMTPEIFRFEETPSWGDEEKPRGMSYFTDIYVPPLDVEGHFINPNKLYYMYYTDNDVPFVFTVDNYSFTEEVDGYDYVPEWTEDFTITPYTFKDEYQEFSNIRTYLRWGEITRLGIQSIYLGGGEEHRSPIHYFGDETAIKDKGVTNVTGEAVYYDLQGRRLQSPVHGINIVKLHDGTTRKVTK